jgi:hypothetical protein
MKELEIQRVASRITFKDFDVFSFGLFDTIEKVSHFALNYCIPKKFEPLEAAR